MANNDTPFEDSVDSSKRWHHSASETAIKMRAQVLPVVKCALLFSKPAAAGM